VRLIRNNSSAVATDQKGLKEILSVKILEKKNGMLFISEYKNNNFALRTL
jgi:hypothetical protein